MNDAELNRLLKSAAPPRSPEEYWEDFPGRVARQLHRPLPPERFVARWPLRLAWAAGVAAVCVAAGFLLGHHFGQTEMANGNGQVLQNVKLIREVMAMFPNRVRAIVKDEAGMQLVLSDSDDVPASTPLWVKISQGEHSVSLVTFSGQELQIRGQKLTVLSEARGGVLVVGDHFVWASEEAGLGAGDLRIQARPLEMASLK